MYITCVCVCVCVCVCTGRGEGSEGEGERSRSDEPAVFVEKLNLVLEPGSSLSVSLSRS